MQSRLLKVDPNPLTTRRPSDSTNFSHNCQAVLTVRNASVADVAKGCEWSSLNKPVVDQTGPHNRFDFDPKWTPDDSQSNCHSDTSRSRDDPNAPPGLYTAIQEQLGLKLIPTKAAIQVMVIPTSGLLLRARPQRPSLEPHRRRVAQGPV
jgi:uncharacterized protein (TIGR03435 family)